MCGRFTLDVSADQLILRFGLDAILYDVSPRYNIAPGQPIGAIISSGTGRRLGPLRWGLVPPWATDPKVGNQMINAKAETIDEKSAFRTPLSRKRCIIPATGFFEWKRAGTRKQPMRIVLKQEDIFAFAGLYETWASPTGEKLSTCTIITTEPNDLMKPIHTRMPVILDQDGENLWLDRHIGDPAILKALLRPYPSNKMHAYPVSPIVGNVRHDSPECIAESGLAME